LSTGIREQFKKKLAERVIEPLIPIWSTKCGIAMCWGLLWPWASGSAMLSIGQADQR
jgi:hypothetical protein